MTIAPTDGRGSAARLTEAMLAAALGCDPTLSDDAVVELAKEARVATVWLWWRLHIHGAAAHPELAATARRRVAAEAVAARRLSAVLTRLADAGIPALVFKGAALSALYYPQPWLRSRNDDDLLVEPEAFDQARHVIEQSGYVSQPQNPGPAESGQAHYTQQFDAGDDHHLDLHWRPCVPRAFAALPAWQALRATQVPLPTLGPGAFAPGAVEHLVLLCAHRVAHHAADDDPLWLLDLHLVAGTLDEAQWNRLTAVAQEAQVARVCGFELARAVAAFDTPVPACVLAALGAASGERTARHLEACTPLHRLGRDLVDEPRRAGRTLMARLAPPVAYMRHRYGVPAPLLPAAYLWRAVGGGGRWLVEALRRGTRR
jgi:transposase-like protein